MLIKSRNDNITILSDCVDDVILAWNNLQDLDDLKQFLETQFKLKDLGQLKYFPGAKIASCNKVTASQWKYALEILEDAAYIGAKSVSFPIE